MSLNKIFTCLALSLVLIGSCRKEKEQVVKATDVGYSAAQNATLADAMYATVLDVVQNLGSTKRYRVIPSNSQIVFQDSSFTDGNGISFYIDFGILGSSGVKGMKCLDAKYRAGRLNCSLSKPVTNTGAILFCKDLSTFYIGNGQEMFLMEGNINSEKTGPNRVSQTHALFIEELNGNATNWNANFEITEEMESYQVKGTAFGKSYSDKKEYNLEVKEAFIKKHFCANTFIDGLAEIQCEGELVEVDFDPYNDKSCDEVIRAALNSFEKIIFLK